MLRAWNLDEGGILVPYYYAGVRSMLQSWHNFFFNAFDPAGFVSLDKPPLAFWLQTASAKLLGFNRFAVLLPQVVEGVAAIALLYWLVRRQFGVPAGLLAALFLALTPISVAVDRSNNTESCLVLVLMLATWAFFCAIETGRPRWLLATAALVGIGFNTKMLVAFGILPGFAAVYLLWSKSPWSVRIGQLTAAAAVVAFVSLSWSAAYDLTAAESRPFVDSSPNNSMLELAIGHNFVDRFVRPARTNRTTAAAATATAPDPAAQPPYRDYAPAGALRLAAPPLAAQIGWLLPLTVIGAIAAWRARPAADRAELTLWAGWAIVYGAVFSAAGGLFHAYYLVVMAPPLCALAAIGTMQLWEARGASRRAALMLPAALTLTVLWQAYIVDFYVTGSLDAGSEWLLLALVGIVLLFAGGLLVAIPSPRAWFVCASCAVAMLLAMPGAWSVNTSLAKVQAGFPASRPPFLTAEAQNRRGRFNQIAGALAGDPKLIGFLEQNRTDETYLLAAVNARLAAPIIISTGQPVIALGGFSGRDPILSIDDFAKLVDQHRLRFALIGEGSPGLRRVFGEGLQQELTAWIRKNGSAVDPSDWRSSIEELASRPAESIGAELYDLRPASAQELRAQRSLP